MAIFVEWRFPRIIERPFNHLLVGFSNPLRDRPLKIKVVEHGMVIDRNETLPLNGWNKPIAILM